jgi:hypothetical protein
MEKKATKARAKKAKFVRGGSKSPKQLAVTATPSVNKFSISDVLEPLRVKHSLTRKRSTTPLGFDEKDCEDHKDDFVHTLSLLKGIIFKRDQPYRTRLPLQGTLTTTAGGLLNLVLSNASISSASEWSSIDALFDEFFTHSFTIHFLPQNNLGGGVGSSNTAGETGGITTTANTQVNNVGMLVCSLFNGAANYGSASAMAANATVAIKHTSVRWKYTWRNNVRFDPRGMNIGSAAVAGFSGWQLVANVSSVGGAIAFRAINDTLIGKLTDVVNLGNYLAFWDISFRARS